MTPSSSNSTESVFILESDALQTIPRAFMLFSENLDEKASIVELQNEIWNKRLKTNQSFVDGYWVKVIIKNITKNASVGFNHNWNREKRIIVSYNSVAKEYPYWKFRSNPALGYGRILGQYNIQIPSGETVVIYNFFRSKPFDRYYGTSGGLDRVTIGSWENVRFRENFRVASSTIFVSVSLAFGLYYLFIFLVSGGNNLWLSLAIFQASITILITQSSGWYLGVPSWISNSEISFCFYSLLFILLIQFFRKSLELEKDYKKIDSTFLVVSIFYAFAFILNLYTGIGWPGPEQLDLVKYPPDNLGPGLIKLKFLVIPFFFVMLTSVVISLLGWIKGKATAKFMFFSFMLPVLSIPIILTAYALFGFTWVTMLIGSTSAGFLFLLMFITFGLAVAQQINDLKQLALVQQVQLTQAYQRFVPKQLLQNLKKESILDVNLGDQVNMEMSIMFSDIRAFTSISEKMNPKENFGFVNSYLNEMGPIVRNHNGYIDKFMGDGIMALFPKNPNDAVQSAIKMQEQLVIFNQSSLIFRGNPIRVGIGINTGKMMLGTIGEADRMEGSVISDAVNLAARLEELTKLYKSKILISDDTLKRLKTDMFVTRLVDFVAVKGRNSAVKVYEVLNAEQEKILNVRLKTLEIFSRAIHLYKEQNIKDSLGLFKQCRELDLDDGAVDYYINKCESLLRDGWDKENWDGINRMEFK